MVTTWEQLQTLATAETTLAVAVPGGHHCLLRVMPVPTVQGLSLYAGTTWLALLPPPASSGVLDYSGLLAEEAAAFWYSQQCQTLDWCGCYEGRVAHTLAGRLAQACACASRTRQGGKGGD